MILELDIGNSRIKWRALSGKDRVAPVNHAANLAELKLQLEKQTGKYRACRICMVRSAQAGIEQIKALLIDHVDGVIAFAESTTELAGVVNAYPEPTQLGVDRWLATVAAYNMVQGACIVIDAGTALTADFVTNGGRHLGGQIAPGFRLLEELLVRSTGLRTGQGEIKTGPQNNTADCLLAGMYCMMHGFVRQVCEEGLSIMGDEPVIVLSGGDAPLVQDALTLPHTVVDDLVFKGLALACPLS